MSEHTKGPWVQFFDDGKPDSILPAMREGEICRFADPKPSEADSRLIAAAPAMYEALDRIFSYVSYINIHGVGEQPDPTPEIGPQVLRCPTEEFWRIFQDIGTRASAAMALAEGPADAAKTGARR